MAHESCKSQIATATTTTNTTTKLLIIVTLNTKLQGHFTHIINIIKRYEAFKTLTMCCMVRAAVMAEVCTDSSAVVATRCVHCIQRQAHSSADRRQRSRDRRVGCRCHHARH